MQKFTLGLLAGILLSAVLFVPFLLSERRNKFELGRKQGEVATKLELMNQVSKLLGDDYRGSDGYNTFLEVKADAIVVVERGGVKTLRNYLGGHSNTP